MNILSAFKKKYDDITRQRKEELSERRQFNMTIDTELINVVKVLAADFGVPRYAVGEHAIEIGCYYLVRAMRSPAKREALRQHLIDGHLLGSGVDQDDSMLMIGEQNLNWLLVDPAKHVLRSLAAFNHALSIAKRTGNVDPLDRCQRELVRSVLRFAWWIEKQGRDESAEAKNEE